MAVELYTNYWLRDLASNYTAGSGTLSVSSAAPVAMQAAGGQFRVRLLNAQNTLLLVTAGASTTTWTVTAEANDANCTAAANAVLGGELTAGMLDQIRIDSHQTGAFASASAYKAGSLYLPTDADVLRRDTGAAFAHWGPLFPLTAPPSVGSLTWVNQGTATASDSYGGIFMSTASTASDSNRILVKSAPATPWTFTVKYQIGTMAANFLNSGICLRESSTGKLISWGLCYNTSGSVGWTSLVSRWNSPTSYSSSPLVAVLGTPSAFFYRVTDNGSNLIYSASLNGQDFSIALLTESRTAFLASGPNQVGLTLDLNNTGHPATLFCYHWAGV
jgi:hypothetical protein